MYSQEENVNLLADRSKHPPATTVVYTSPGFLQLASSLLLRTEVYTEKNSQMLSIKLYVPHILYISDHVDTRKKSVLT